MLHLLHCWNGVAVCHCVIERKKLRKFLLSSCFSPRLRTLRNVAPAQTSERAGRAGRLGGGGPAAGGGDANEVQVPINLSRAANGDGLSAQNLQV